MKVTRAVLVVAVTLVSSSAASAPAVVSADISVIVTSPTSCQVTMALRVDEVTGVEHRIESFDAARVHLEEVAGARLVRGPHTIGRTESVLLRLEGPAYQIRYRFDQDAARRDRCPIWVPTIPTTAQLGTVTLQVSLPDLSQPSASMPALTWAGSVGATTLGHIPAFVRAPYASMGTAPGWDLSRIMDGLAVTVLVGASIVWLWRRRRDSVSVR